MNSFTVIIYHAGCPDGATAAAIARRANPEAGLYPLANGRTVDDLENESIVMVDITVPAGNLMELNSKNNRVVVLDHHASAERVLAEFTKPRKQIPGVMMPRAPEVHFDMNRSGAGMAWDYFFPGQPRPEFVNYIEDHDLWKFALPDSRVIRTFFSMQKFRDVDEVDKRIKKFEEPGVRESVVETGTMIMEYQEEVLFPQMARKAFAAIMMNYQVIVCPCTILELVSEFGNWLVKKYSDHHFVLLWDEDTMSSNMTRRCMLRGSDKVDLSMIAQSFGGGGHKNAAGFRSTSAEFTRLFTFMHSKPEIITDNLVVAAASDSPENKD